LSGQYGQVIFIVWRESIEALLIVGIIYAWLTHQGGEDARRGKYFLFLGVLAGLVIAVLLAAGILVFSKYLSDAVLEYFQMTMVFVAAALILQMICWLRQHGRSLKKNLEVNIGSFIKQANWWGIFTLTTLAIAREGSETVIFLYGILNASVGNDSVIILSITVALVIAFLTYFLIQLGQRYFSWRTFFRFTETVLLFLGASLVVKGVDYLVSLGVIDFESPILWDSAVVLDDAKTFGNFIAGLTGYRAQVDMIWLVTYTGYWCVAFLLLNMDRLCRQKRANKDEKPTKN
jgi:high-affinity iron transporter